jgi:hypothetical protein
MIHFLARAYRRIGIHASPPGTLFFFLHCLVQRVVHRRIFGYASGNLYARSRFGGTPYYDIVRLRRTRSVDGLALVYFMGVGDYLMTTPMIQALHLAHPDLPIYAYTSSHADTVNSPLVSQLLRTNPLIDRVFTYHGRPRTIWTDYDFADALKDIPPGFIILPVVYEVEPVILHRVTALLETFGLPVDLPVAAPIAYKNEMSAEAGSILLSIRERIAAASARAVVCTHFGARSSGYEYPHADDLIGRLVRAGYMVISFSPTNTQSQYVIKIDVATITPGDTIEILRALRSSGTDVYMISVNSLMWPITAALGIANLGLHTFWDPAIHQYLYPNIFVVTQHLYPNLSPSRLFLAPYTTYQERKLVGGTLFTDYKADYVADCLEWMVSAPIA